MKEERQRSASPSVHVGINPNPKTVVGRAGAGRAEQGHIDVCGIIRFTVLTLSFFTMHVIGTQSNQGLERAKEGARIVVSYE